MKTISKKIKSIYLLAIMAILSICVAVFPAFKTQSVKAEEESIGLSVTGANLEFGERYAHKDFVLMFQAEIATDWYSTLGTESEIKFGMAIGPTSKLGEVETYDDLKAVEAAGNVKIFDSLVGNADEVSQAIMLTDEQDAFTYEAGTLFSAFVPNYENLTDAQWQAMYAVELTAIAFYSVDGVVEFNSDIKYATSAKQAAIDTLYAETALPVSQATMSLESAEYITGKTFKVPYYDGYEIYYDQKQNVFLANQHLNHVSYLKLNTLRAWFPSKPIASSATLAASALCRADYDTYLAGQEMKVAASKPTATSSTGLAITTDFLDDINVLKEMIPGETYACYFTIDGQIYRFEYQVVTAAFSAFSKGGSAQGTGYGSNLSNSLTEYFALNFRPTFGTFYGPDSYLSTETDSYDGYYILSNDIITSPANDGITLTERKNMGASNEATTGQKYAVKASLASAFSGSINATTISLGALKSAGNYRNTLKLEGSTGGFTGTFDGRGYTIDASFARGGLFGVINGGTVKNVNINANLYQYELSSSTINYAASSYAENNAVLAELIYDATIENVSITLKESAPKTFEYTPKEYPGGIGTDLTTPEMETVPGLIASQGIYGDTTLKNVVVTIDTLKDAGVSIQNYRAALNVSEECTLENVFVIGSSYSNMSLEVVEADGAKEYVLTLSAPEGIEPGTYAIGDNEALADYFEMAKDMFKYLKSVNVEDSALRVKFIAEPATAKFATDEDFQAWIDGEAGADAKAALIESKMWVEDQTTGYVAWHHIPVVDVDYVIYAHTSQYALADKPTADTSANPFGWTDFTTYNPTIVTAG